MLTKIGDYRSVRHTPSLHFSPPDGRRTRYDRHDFVALACRAQRTVQVRLRAKRLAPRPNGPLTHFGSPRGEKCRLTFQLPGSSWRSTSPDPAWWPAGIHAAPTSESSMASSVHESCFQATNRSAEGLYCGALDRRPGAGRGRGRNVGARALGRPVDPGVCLGRGMVLMQARPRSTRKYSLAISSCLLITSWTLFCW